MPRDGSGVYHRPPGTDGVPNQTISSAAYNVWVADVEQTFNLPYPIVAGGTGATNAADALTGLGGEMRSQKVDDFNTFTFTSGSWSSDMTSLNWPGSPSAPVATFSGVAVVNANDPTYVFLEAWKHTDNSQWFRSKYAGTWGPWTQTSSGSGSGGSGGSISSSTAGMGAGFIGSNPNGSFVVNTAPDLSGTNALQVGENGNTYLQGTSGDVGFFLNKASSGHISDIVATTAGSSRWRIRISDSTAETGASSGSDFDVMRYDNSGNYIDTPFKISRSNGYLTLGPTMGNIQIGGTSATSMSGLFGDGTSIGLRAFGTSGAIYFQNAGSSGSYTTYLTLTPTLGTFAQDIYLNGSNATKASGTTWANPSDMRIKDHIRDYHGGLEEILNLWPVQFKYRAETGYPEEMLNKTHVGLIAQQVEQTMPEMVTRVEGKIGEFRFDDLRVLDTSNLIFALVNAVKELSGRVEVLEARLASIPG